MSRDDGNNQSALSKLCAQKDGILTSVLNSHQELLRILKARALLDNFQGKPRESLHPQLLEYFLRSAPSRPIEASYSRTRE
jgi:hypothetical protein